MIEFWYEFASTYSYPAAMRVEAVAARRGVRVAWRPFLLGPIFKDLGWTTSPFNTHPAKGAYMWRDLARTCAALDLGFQRPEPFPQNGLPAARIALALPDDAPAPGSSQAVYRAEFADGQKIDNLDVLSSLLTAEGHEAEGVLTSASSPETKQALRDQTDTARTHGIFGAPTWRTPDGEVFWGNDRLEDALDWMASAKNNA